MLLRYDFHVHTSFSTCADPAMSVAAIVAECERIGLDAVGLADHYYGPDRLAEQAERLDEIRAISSPVAVYFGAESGFSYRLGRHPLSRQDQARHGFQYAIGSHHSTYLREYDLARIVAVQHEHHLRTIEDPSVDVLGHPWRFLKPEFDREGWPWLDSMKPVPESMTRELARAAVENSKPIEINTTSDLTNLKVPESYQREYADYVAILNEEGVTFSLASDAHAVDELATIRAAWDLVERLGIPAERIWRPACEPANDVVPGA